MESLNNIGHICSECSEDRRESWQNKHQHLLVSVGDAVKIRFRAGRFTEWMWVLVTNIRSESYHGVLINDGILVHMVYGEPVSFLRTDIADYCKDNDFDNYAPWEVVGHVATN